MSRRRLLYLVPLLLCPAIARAGPHQELGKAEGRCRPGEPGPALLVSALGLKDRSGNLKLEVDVDPQSFL